MDVDGDGHQDILSGSWPGELYLFRGDGAGGFSEKVQLVDANDKPLNCGSASTVTAADWDGDGDLDLLIGNISGDVWLARNEGSANKPRFAFPVALQSEGRALKVSGYSHPVFVDWDGNGQRDLICGHGAGVVWFRNTAQAGEPQLSAAQTLVSGVQGGADPNKPGSRLKVCVTDWNGDGELDLLVGDLGMTSIETRKLSAEEIAQRDELQAKLVQLSQEINQEVGPRPKSDDKAAVQAWSLAYGKAVAARPDMAKIRSELQKYNVIQREYRGNVWLLQRRRHISTLENTEAPPAPPVR